MLLLEHFSYLLLTILIISIDSANNSDLIQGF